MLSGGPGRRPSPLCLGKVLLDTRYARVPDPRGGSSCKAPTAWPAGRANESLCRDRRHAASLRCSFASVWIQIASQFARCAVAVRPEGVERVGASQQQIYPRTTQLMAQSLKLEALGV